MIKQILNILRGGNTSSPPVEKLKPIPATRNVKLEVGDTVAGEFKILQIFEGGMGYVYLTQDPLEGFQFVLKTYKQELSASARQSFIKEAYSWIQIGFHPNILQAYWVRELDSKLFVAAQYIPKDDNGHNSLADYIRGGALSDKLLFSFVAQFCHGMAHAYKAGVSVHRDIKPDNILIYQGTLKISDFGLAKAREFVTPPILADQTQNEVGFSVWETQRGAVSGTPPYMAPEQFLGTEHTDTRTDIYSFGITIWEALAGRPPFLGRSISEFAIQHRDSAAPELKHPLWPLIAKCLSKNPSDRYKSFSDLLIDLQKVAMRAGIQLPPEPKNVDPELEGLFAKAQSWMALGFPEKAIVDIEKYTRLRPDADCGWIEKARILLQQNDAEGALESCRRSLAICETSTAAWNNYGIALSRLKRYEEAIDSFKKAIEIEPKNTGAMLNLSGPLVDLRKFDEAISILNKALGIAPKKASIWNNLGTAYRRIGNKQDAAICYEKAIELDPNCKEARNNLRSLATGEKATSYLIQQGKLSEAKQILIADTRELNRADDWHNLGLIYLDEGNPDEAMMCFQRVVVLSPGDDFAYRRIIDLFAGRRDFESALEVCEKWLRFGSDKVTPICCKAQLSDYSGRSEDAIAMLHAYAERFKANAQFSFMLSLIHERSGQISAALQSAERNLEILLNENVHNPDNISLAKKTIDRLNKKLVNPEHNAASDSSP